MNVNPKNFKDKNRDRFILSKGHAGAGVYAVLAESGFFSIELLKTHYKDGSALSGHVSHKNIPGVELSTGSLGHGLSVGVGLAISAKLDKRKNKVIVLLSDGECDEGSNWEAILYANHFELSNLTVVVDYNKLQSLNSTDNTMTLEPFAEKWISFGWDLIECDGHDHKALKSALDKKSTNPKVIIANTTKGFGVSFMENNVLWHYRSPQGQEYKDAMLELDNNEK